MVGRTGSKRAILVAFGCMASGCGGGGGGETPPPVPPQPVTPPTPAPQVTIGFADVTSASGIAFEVGFVRPLADIDLALTPLGTVRAR
ncbi:MAG: hypothetical protein OXH09_05910, partial [Gammaproteobacteria bacterium]|nr:hypothetical protein [Gammaproteobacteria bacterium]